MEIKITIKKHEVDCEMPYEAILEETDFNDKFFKPLPNYSNKNEFFKDEVSAEKWILEQLQKRFKPKAKP